MIKIISRKSDLAVIQAELVAEALKKADRNISISFVKKETEGDICLLYTSPSPRDRQKSRMPSSA